MASQTANVCPGLSRRMMRVKHKNGQRYTVALQKIPILCPGGKGCISRAGLPNKMWRGQCTLDVDLSNPRT